MGNGASKKAFPSLEGWDENKIDIATLQRLHDDDPTLTSLKLSDKNLEDEGINVLSQAIANNTHLKSLFLCRNGCGVSAARDLATFLLRKNCPLQVLYLGGNEIGDEGAQIMATVVASNTSLEELYLYDNDITHRGASIIAEGLKKNDHLRVLDLWRNQLGPEGAIALADGLSNNNTLERLYLRENAIGVAGTEALANSLKVNDSLKVLSLSRNRFGVKGAQALAEGIKNNKRLEQLNLIRNEIGSEGCQALVYEGLQTNTSVRVLWLDGNEIGDEGAEAIAYAIKNNYSPVLEDVRLSANSITDVGAEMLGDSLKSNQPLRRLNLMKNKIGDKGVRSIADGIAANSTLLHLNLVVNAFSDEGLNALAHGLNINTSITGLELYEQGGEPQNIKNSLERNVELAKELNPVRKANVFVKYGGAVRGVPTLYKLCLYSTKKLLDENKLTYQGNKVFHDALNKKLRMLPVPDSRPEAWMSGMSSYSEDQLLLNLGRTNMETFDAPVTPLKMFGSPTPSETGFSYGVPSPLMIPSYSTGLGQSPRGVSPLRPGMLTVSTSARDMSSPVSPGAPARRGVGMARSPSAGTGSPLSRSFSTDQQMLHSSSSGTLHPAIPRSPSNPTAVPMLSPRTGSLDLSRPQHGLRASNSQAHGQTLACGAHEEDARSTSQTSLMRQLSRSSSRSGGPVVVDRSAAANCAPVVVTSSSPVAASSGQPSLSPSRSRENLGMERSGSHTDSLRALTAQNVLRRKLFGRSPSGSNASPVTATPSTSASSSSGFSDLAAAYSTSQYDTTSTAAAGDAFLANALGSPVQHPTSGFPAAIPVNAGNLRRSTSDSFFRNSARLKSSSSAYHLPQQPANNADYHGLLDSASYGSDASDDQLDPATAAAVLHQAGHLDPLLAVVHDTDVDVDIVAGDAQNTDGVQATSPYDDVVIEHNLADMIHDSHLMTMPTSIPLEQYDSQGPVIGAQDSFVTADPYGVPPALSDDTGIVDGSAAPVQQPPADRRSSIRTLFGGGKKKRGNSVTEGTPGLAPRLSFGNTYVPSDYVPSPAYMDGSADGQQLGELQMARLIATLPAGISPAYKGGIVRTTSYSHVRDCGHLATLGNLHGPCTECSLVPEEVYQALDLSTPINAEPPLPSVSNNLGY